jgi:hypothetical protein
MQQSHRLPDVVTYSAAISACEKGEQWQEALGALGGDAAVWSCARRLRLQCSACLGTELAMNSQLAVHFRIWHLSADIFQLTSFS